MSEHDRLTPMGAADRDAITRALCLAFGGTAEGVADWMKMAGEEHVRVLRDDARVGASLLRIPMGQYFGGRSVPMLGVAAVAVSPESRGRGLAKRMMRAFVRDAATEGWPLAALYASTHTLYRAVGFEHAGYRFQYTVPLIRVDVRERGAPLVLLSDADMPAIKACYARFARIHDGMLDRGDYIWSRVRKIRDAPYTGFGVRRPDGALDGYVFLNQARRPDGRHDVSLSDIAFADAPTGRRLLSFLGDFEMMGHDLLFAGGPSHPALTLLQQQRHRIELKDCWLIRLLDARKALEGRGYPPATNAEVHLDIADDLVPANHGRFTLRVREGRGEVSSGGRGEVRATIRGLAMVYSGYSTLEQAALVGLVEGDPGALARAAGVFGAGTPWMTDHF